MQTNGLGWQVQSRVKVVSGCIRSESDGHSRSEGETFHLTCSEGPTRRQDLASDAVAMINLFNCFTLLVVYTGPKHF